MSMMSTEDSGSTFEAMSLSQVPPGIPKTDVSSRGSPGYVIRLIYDKDAAVDDGYDHSRSDNGMSDSFARRVVLYAEKLRLTILSMYL
jgi:hypothetical protein